MPSLGDAQDLDRADPLAAFREEFVVDDRGPIYADGNSLGRLPKGTLDALDRLTRDQWGRSLVGSWEEWLDLPTRAGDLIGRHLIGARPGETVVADSTTVNFYKLAVAALRARPGRRVVVTDASNFPTNRFVLQGLDCDIAIAPPDPSPADVDGVLRANEGDVALVTLSHVAYRSGARLDLPAITQLAHDAGALVLWDLSHAAGSVRVDLADNAVDLAVGCTYKYLNGGPGSPAFLYVRADLQAELAQPVQGWFGAADQFAMGPVYAPAAGITRFLSGTPPVLGIRAVEVGVDVLARAGIDALAEKGRALTSFVIACADELLGGMGFEVVTPRDPHRRGAHVALRHDEAWRITRSLVADARVVPDYREPDVIRLGFAPVYSRFADGFEAIDRLRRIVSDRLYERHEVTRSRVT